MKDLSGRNPDSNRSRRRTEKLLQEEDPNSSCATLRAMMRQSRSY
jgi:hypothetical protein